MDCIINEVTTQNFFGQNESSGTRAGSSLSYIKMQCFTQYEGQTRKVLFESLDKNSMIEDYTDNYIKITAPYKRRMGE